jgi:hypothetical protein
MNIETISAIDGKTYKFFNGTNYHVDTPDSLINVLDSMRLNHTRIVMEQGDKATRTDWGDSQEGYIGRSGGKIKIPIVLFSARSIGGPAILEQCIIRVKTTKGKRLLWSAW